MKCIANTLNWMSIDQFSNTIKQIYSPTCFLSSNYIFIIWSLYNKYKGVERTVYSIEYFDICLKALNYFYEVHIL